MSDAETNHNGVPDNPLGICDRCVAQILAGLPAFVACGAMTQAAADEWLAAITASRFVLRRIVAASGHDAHPEGWRLHFHVAGTSRKSMTRAQVMVWEIVGHEVS